jgi:hypothetical protein
MIIKALKLFPAGMFVVPPQVVVCGQYAESLPRDQPLMGNSHHRYGLLELSGSCH